MLKMFFFLDIFLVNFDICFIHSMKYLTKFVLQLDGYYCTGYFLVFKLILLVKRTAQLNAKKSTNCVNIF